MAKRVRRRPQTPKHHGLGSKKVHSGERPSDLFKGPRYSRKMKYRVSY